MSKVNDGGPAFPVTGLQIDGGVVRLDPVHHGVSLRALYAGLAMAAMLAKGLPEEYSWTALAEGSCNAADALIAELEKGA